MWLIYIVFRHHRFPFRWLFAILFFLRQRCPIQQINWLRMFLVRLLRRKLVEFHLQSVFLEDCYFDEINEETLDGKERIGWKPLFMLVCNQKSQPLTGNESIDLDSSLFYITFSVPAPSICVYYSLHAYAKPWQEIKKPLLVLTVWLGQSGLISYHTSLPSSFLRPCPSSPSPPQPPPAFVLSNSFHRFFSRCPLAALGWIFSCRPSHSVFKRRRKRQNSPNVCNCKSLPVVAAALAALCLRFQPASDPERARAVVSSLFGPLSTHQHTAVVLVKVTICNRNGFVSAFPNLCVHACVHLFPHLWSFLLNCFSTDWLPLCAGHCRTFLYWSVGAFTVGGPLKSAHTFLPLSICPICSTILNMLRSWTFVYFVCRRCSNPKLFLSPSPLSFSLSLSLPLTLCHLDSSVHLFACVGLSLLLPTNILSLSLRICLPHHHSKSDCSSFWIGLTWNLNSSSNQQNGVHRLHKRPWQWPNKRSSEYEHRSWIQVLGCWSKCDLRPITTDRMDIQTSDLDSKWTARIRRGQCQRRTRRWIWSGNRRIGQTMLCQQRWRPKNESTQIQ